MSVDAVMETPKATKQRKSKDRSEHKSSKKRRREEQDATQSSTKDITTIETSPSKKPRTDKSAHTTKSSASHPHAADADILTIHTPFVTQTTSLYLPLAPSAHNLPIQGLCAEHISPYLLSYHPPLNGILLSYSNPRLSSTPHSVPSHVPDSAEHDESDHGASAPRVLVQSVDEYGVGFVWLTAEFLLLRPRRGTWIEAEVRVQNPSYLGLVCWNFFNAGVERRRLPADWVWVDGTGAKVGRRQEEGEEVGDGAVPDANGDGTEEEAKDHEGAEAATDAGAMQEVDENTGAGYFVDGNGQKIQGLIKFRVRDFESVPSTEREKGFVNIEGTLLSEEEDKKADDELSEKTRDKSKGRRLGGANGSRPLV